MMLTSQGYLNSFTGRRKWAGVLPCTKTGKRTRASTAMLPRRPAIVMQREIAVDKANGQLLVFGYRGYMGFYAQRILCSVGIFDNQYRQSNAVTVRVLVPWPACHGPP